MPASADNTEIIVKIVRTTGIAFLLLAVGAALDAGGVISQLGLRDQRAVMAGVLAAVGLCDLIVVPAVLRRAWRQPR